MHGGKGADKEEEDEEEGGKIKINHLQWVVMELNLKVQSSFSFDI